MSWLDGTRWTCQLGLGLLVAAGAAQHGLAQLRIELEYEARQSDPPSGDPYGYRLIGAMTRAAGEWEGFFPDATETIQIQYRWQDIRDDENEPLGLIRHLIPWNGTRFRVRFDTHEEDGDEVRWFFDTTPELDEEFVVWQQDLAHDGEASWLSNEHPLLEYAFHGLSDPYRRPASTGHDLVSVALHEVAHALLWPAHGDAGSSGHFVADAGFLSRFLGGGAGTLQIAAYEDDDGEVDDSHFAATTSLMYPFSRSPGVRVLPAAPEILAITTVRGWGDVRLPRAELLVPGGHVGDYFWYDWGIWLGDLAPNGGRSAFVRDENIDEDVVLGSAATLGDLTLSHDGLVDLADNLIRLRVVGTSLAVLSELTVEVPEGRSGATELLVEAPGTLSAGEVSIRGALVEIQSQASLHRLAAADSGGPGFRLRDGAVLRVGGGPGSAYGLVDNDPGHMDLDASSLELFGGRVQTRRLTLDRESQAWGSGEVRGLYQLVNDGLLQAVNGPLTFATASADGLLDLDGEDEDEPGGVDADLDSIHFRGAIADEFNSWMWVGHELTFDHGWTLGKEGLLRFTADGARVSAPEVQLLSDARIEAPVESTLDASSVFWNEALVLVDGELLLAGDIRYEGGDYIGSGILTQGGTAMVAADVEIDVATFAMDGDRYVGGAYIMGSTSTTVATGARLDVLHGIGVTAGDGFDGELVLSSGSEADFAHSLQIDPTGSVDIGAGATLECSGLRNLGTITGEGTLVITAPPYDLGTIDSTISVVF